jgi:hypothetical protein
MTALAGKDIHYLMHPLTNLYPVLIEKWLIPLLPISIQSRSCQLETTSQYLANLEASNKSRIVLPLGCLVLVDSHIPSGLLGAGTLR